jgi:quercetin dioxygenase-like cupin family protein
MEPFLVTLTPTDSTQVEPNQHIGEEILFVLEGEVEVRLLDKTEILNPGDSIYYDSTMPHVVSCHGKEPATMLAVIYAKDEMIIL